jgi:hypothetical protein
MNQKLPLLFLLLFKFNFSKSQLPSPIHTFTFDSTLSNTAGTTTFTPSTALLTNNTWGYSSDRFGEPNKCFISAGSNSGRRLTASISNLPQGAGARTISFWYSFGMSGAVNYLFSYGTGTTNNAYGLTQSFNDVNNYGWNNDLIINNISYTSTTNGTWYHYVVVYDGSTASIYRNGQLLGSGAKVWNTIGTTFYIGCVPTLSQNYFLGKIDDLQIYNVALTPAQITDLYVNQLGVNTSSVANNMLAYYGFNGNISSHNNTHNLAAATGTVNYSAGKVGTGALSLSGSTVLENTSLATPLTNSNFTVAFWLKRSLGNFNYSSVFEMFGSCFYRYNFTVSNQYELGAAVLTVLNAPNVPQFISGFVAKPLADEWVHVAIVYEKVGAGNNNGYLRLYEGGVQTSTVHLGLIRPDNIYQYNNKFTVGGGTNANGTINTVKNYIGEIDEMFVFNRSLTDLEIMYLMSSQSVTLPSQLTNFTAQLKNDRTQLFWRTQTETNTSHFNIEYSNNARDYTTVGEVQAAGNSSFNKQYSFSHAINKQITHYYRLKMVDKDGSSTYSNVIKLQNNGVVGIELYPNPVKNQLNISYQFSGREEAVIRISTIEGKVLQTQKMVLEQQGNVGVDVSRLTPGAYVVEVITANSRTVKQVMKE